MLRKLITAYRKREVEWVWGTGCRGQHFDEIPQEDREDDEHTTRCQPDVRENDVVDIEGHVLQHLPACVPYTRSDVHSVYWFSMLWGEPTS